MQAGRVRGGARLLARFLILDDLIFDELQRARFAERSRRIDWLRRATAAQSTLHATERGTSDGGSISRGRRRQGTGVDGTHRL